MRILHYFLGFPPYRTGGLTKYALDLMETQISDGNRVAALWPGTIIKIGGRPSIKKNKSINEIDNYELINPLPVPLDEGILDVEKYTKSCDENLFIDFFDKNRFDVIHIHSLMGLYKELIDVAQKKHIRTVFTTHDYFGICPKVNLFHYGVPCENDNECKDCVQCNATALSMKKIQLLQSPIYRCLKDSSIIKKLRKKHRKNYFTHEIKEDYIDSTIQMKAAKYVVLRQYYVDMLEKIDIIHFNSSVAKKVYMKFIRPKNYKTISITHRNISDNRRRYKYDKNDKIKITYLSPAKPYKGFNILKGALDQLWHQGNKNFNLILYGVVNEVAPYMIIHNDGYTYDELNGIFSEADILVAPSIWYETFGFTVLEAISFGVPVIVSDHVGAKDIVGEGGIVIKANSEEELKNVFIKLTKEKIEIMNDIIYNQISIKSWGEFMKENYELYKS